MEMEKVGIITFHSPLNFGSALQAYALEQILKKYGYQPEVIDFILQSDMIQYRLFRRHLYLEHPKALVRDVLCLPNYLRRKRNFEAFAERYLRVSRKRYYAGKSDLQELNAVYDAFVCGSDQIWNLNCTGRWIPEYFLEFAAKDKKKIAYAPSMPSRVNEVYYPQLRRSIGRLDAVSVREAQTVAYLQEEVGVEPGVTLAADPTLLLAAENYRQAFSLGAPQKKHIFVYILGEIDRRLVEKAAELARKTGFSIKYVFGRPIRELLGENWAIHMGPVEFLESINDAAYVITNSFHASVFAVHFHKPLCAFPRPGSSSRISNLLRQLDLEDSLYVPDNDRWMTHCADAETDKKRRVMAADSLAFLLGALAGGDQAPPEENRKSKYYE